MVSGAALRDHLRTSEGGMPPDGWLRGGESRHSLLTYVISDRLRVHLKLI